MLPLTTMAEENGTYVNRDGRVQLFQQAKGAPAWRARRGGWRVRCSRAPGRTVDAPGTGAEAFAALGRYYPAFAGLTHATSASPGGCCKPQLAGAAR